MASAGVSGTVTVDDQRSYSRIENFRGKNPRDTLSSSSAVCG